MRKLSLILVALALVMTSVTSAAVVSEDLKVIPTEKQIGELLENPSFEMTSEEKAFVTFIINEDHEIVVLTVDTDNESVDKFVKSRLNYNKLEGALKVGHEYKVPIVIQYVS